jgi:hypothetical protein
VRWSCAARPESARRSRWSTSRPRRPFRIAHATGVVSELELPFAGLHQLSARMPDRIERLPVPQRDALLTALGLKLDTAPDPFAWCSWPYSVCWPRLRVSSPCSALSTTPSGSTAHRARCWPSRIAGSSRNR